jgi:hypothetical protein
MGISRIAGQKIMIQRRFNNLRMIAVINNKGQPRFTRSHPSRVKTGWLSGITLIMKGGEPIKANPSHHLEENT